MRRVLCSAIVCFGLLAAAPGRAQDVTGIAVPMDEAPALLTEVTASAGGFWNSDGVSLNLGYFNAVPDRSIDAVEILVIGLNPWNVVRLSESMTIVHRLGSARSHRETVQYPYLGKKDIMTVVGVVTKVRHADGRIWSVPKDSLTAQLNEAVAGLDFSAVPLALPDTDVTGRSGAFAFTSLLFLDGWLAPVPEGACVRYDSAGGVATAVAAINSEGPEFLNVQRGGYILVCETVAHVVQRTVG